jgi:predicted transcriptional regulator
LSERRLSPVNRSTLNSDRFVDAFNRIEKWLRKTAKAQRGASFYALVDGVGRSNAAVRHYAFDLKEFADLRNAIIHERTDDHVIAEPNDRTVAEIEGIAARLTNPPQVIPLFQTEVLVLQITGSVTEAVKPMCEQSFSQVPVYDGKDFAGVLTTNTVARWLGSCAEEEIFSLTETTIRSILKYTEDEDNHAFLGRGATLFDVLEMFEAYQGRGKRLEAILLTENGKPTEKLLGVVTIWDLPKVRSVLEGG